MWIQKSYDRTFFCREECSLQFEEMKTLTRLNLAMFALTKNYEREKRRDQLHQQQPKERTLMCKSPKRRTVSNDSLNSELNDEMESESLSAAEALNNYIMARAASRSRRQRDRDGLVALRSSIGSIGGESSKKRSFDMSSMISAANEVEQTSCAFPSIEWDSPSSNEFQAPNGTAGTRKANNWFWIAALLEVEMVAMALP